MSSARKNVDDAAGDVNDEGDKDEASDDAGKHHNYYLRVLIKTTGFKTPKQR